MRTILRLFVLFALVGITAACAGQAEKKTMWTYTDEKGQTTTSTNQVNCSRTAGMPLPPGCSSYGYGPYGGSGYGYSNFGPDYYTRAQIYTVPPTYLPNGKAVCTRPARADYSGGMMTCLLYASDLPAPPDYSSYYSQGRGGWAGGVSWGGGSGRWYGTGDYYTTRNAQGRYVQRQDVRPGFKANLREEGGTSSPELTRDEDAELLRAIEQRKFQEESDRKSQNFQSS